MIVFATLPAPFNFLQEAQKSKANIWWNVWVMLAMPAIWLTWYVILYDVNLRLLIVMTVEVYHILYSVHHVIHLAN